jgi:hypothetical protein
MCITREAAHAFAAATPRDIVFRPSGRGLSTAELLPLRALRLAQLQALDVHITMAELLADLLLPPAPCADAGAERLLLDAARFLLHSGVIPTARMPDEATAPAFAFCDDYWKLRDNCDELLADLSFFMDAQLRAAEARGQPLHEAFSFSGRTLASVARLAAQHRRDALVAAAVAKMRLDGGMFFNSDKPCGLWREPLAWDEECDRMLALRYPDAGQQRLCSVRWCADVQLDGTTAAAGQDVATPLHGEWHMQRLYTKTDIRAEGKAQSNCLSYRSMSMLHTSPPSSYWSLQFTPDAASAARLAATTQLRCAAAQLRLTVHVDGDAVREVRAPSNAEPPLAALQALAEWGRRVGVRVPQYTTFFGGGHNFGEHQEVELEGLDNWLDVDEQDYNW